MKIVYPIFYLLLACTDIRLVRLPEAAPWTDLDRLSAHRAFVDCPRKQGPEKRCVKAIIKFPNGNKHIFCEKEQEIPGVDSHTEEEFIQNIYLRFVKGNLKHKGSKK